MEKDVLISIRGLQYLMDEESGEQEPVEVMTTGSYYKKNGHHFLIYDEATEGFDMMTHNMIKFTENALEVRKRGLIDVHMIFEEDKKNISFYHTPYGMINMGVAATKVRMKETPDQIFYYTVLFPKLKFEKIKVGVKNANQLVSNEELEQRGQVTVSFEGLLTWASLYNGRLSVKAEAANIRKAGTK